MLSSWVKFKFKFKYEQRLILINTMIICKDKLNLLPRGNNSVGLTDIFCANVGGLAWPSCVVCLCSSRVARPTLALSNMLLDLGVTS